MNIGIIIGRIGGVDGVARETEKWIEVLRSMGHQVFVVSGQYQERTPDPAFEDLLPSLSFFAPESVWSQKKAFFHPDSDPDELITHVQKVAGQILEHLLAWVRNRQIDLLISENASSLPSHLEMGLAISELVKQTGLPAIAHDHDFAWERGDRYRSSNQIIRDFIGDIFPLRAPQSVHAVINTDALGKLEGSYGAVAVNVPNVMDFTKPFGKQGPANRALAERLGFQKNDILLFQMTRLLRRKKIETAIDLVHRLNDPRIKLVITGGYTDDAGSAYFNQLSQLVHDLSLSRQVRFASEFFGSAGREEASGNLGRFTLSDAYAIASACTYFSTHEGFGNVVVEAILAKCPLFVNNYEPVFTRDIASKGIRTVMIEHGHLTDEAVAAMADVLYHPSLAVEMTEHNYRLGKLHFSYETLEAKLVELIALATNQTVQRP